MNLEEAKRGPLSQTVTALVSAGKLVIRDPSRESIDDVARVAIEIGDLPKLSEADLAVLALALELSSEGYEVTVISDDYSVQNVALALNLATVGATVRKAGLLKWIYYCPACGAAYERCDSRVCPRCGTELKRRAR
jgi:UPF0271 protein